MTTITAKIGQRFHMLEVTESIGLDKYKKPLYRVKCDCGTCKDVNIYALRKLKSCGCAKGRLCREVNLKHGMRGKPVYQTWANMVQRCTNPKGEYYKDYGARGITVCSKWHTFGGFWEDMGPTYIEGCQIDRVNVDGNYEKDNCRWVTNLENARNKRYSRTIDTPLGEMPIWEAVEVSGLVYSCLLWRADNGWSKDRIFEKAPKLC